MVLRLISCSPRWPGSFATVITGIASANLTPASGCQDHTTSPSAFVPFVNGTISVHRIPSRVRDDREAPSVGRDGDGYKSDLGQTRSGIFLQPRLDRFLADGQITPHIPVILRCEPCGALAPLGELSKDGPTGFHPSRLAKSSHLKVTV